MLILKEFFPKFLLTKGLLYGLKDEYFHVLDYVLWYYIPSFSLTEIFLVYFCDRRICYNDYESEEPSCSITAHVVVNVTATNIVSKTLSNSLATCCHSNLILSLSSCSASLISFFSIVWFTLWRMRINCCSNDCSTLQSLSDCCW